MISKLYGKSGQEYEVQGYASTNEGQVAAVVLDTKTKKVHAIALSELDTVNAEDRVELQEKLTKEAHEEMMKQKESFQSPNGKSGMSASEAAAYASKVGRNTQGQKLEIDPETKKEVAIPSSEDHVEPKPSEGDFDEKHSTLDKVKEKLHLGKSEHKK